MVLNQFKLKAYERSLFEPEASTIFLLLINYLMVLMCFNL